MLKSSVLVLDDKDYWIAQLKFQLEEIGEFRCLYSRTGQETINKIKEDYKQEIKIVLTDELLLVDGEDDGEKQRYQGKDVRKEIYKIRPDIQFIVISDLPYRIAKEIGDFNQGILKAMQLTAELSQDEGVIGMLDKPSLENSTTSKQKYQWLFKTIREALGEAAAPKKPGIYIGLGLPRSSYTSLIQEIGLTDKSGIRLYEYLEKSLERASSDGKKTLEQAQRRQLVNKFLRERSGIKPNIKEFLSSVPSKKHEREALVRQLPLRIDRILTRKVNSNRFSYEKVDISSMKFRTLIILAMRSECGDSPTISEVDYIYPKRQPKAIEDTGLVGISEYSRHNAIESPYQNLDDFDRYDSNDSFETENHLREQQVMKDTAYEWKSDSLAQKATIRSARNSSPLKTAISRLNEEFREQKFGQLENISVEVKINGEQQTVNGYRPSFQTGIILYPFDDE